MFKTFCRMAIMRAVSVLKTFHKDLLFRSNKVEKYISISLAFVLLLFLSVCLALNILLLTKTSLLLSIPFSRSLTFCTSFSVFLSFPTFYSVCYFVCLFSKTLPSYVKCSSLFVIFIEYFDVLNGVVEPLLCILKSFISNFFLQNLYRTQNTITTNRTKTG